MTTNDRETHIMTIHTEGEGAVSTSALRFTVNGHECLVNSVRLGVADGDGELVCGDVVIATIELPVRLGK